MSRISDKLRKWVNPANGDEGLSYYCQGCESNHSVKTKGAGAWGWSGDVDKPVFTPSVLLSTTRLTNKGNDDIEAWRAAGMPSRNGAPFESVPFVCHSFVGCNGAQPGEVIFLSDCTHALAGQVLPFAYLPEWMR